MKIAKFTLSLLISALVVACGGGGDESEANSQIIEAPVDQSGEAEKVVNKNVTYFVYRSDLTTGTATAMVNYDPVTEDGSIVFSNPSLTVSTTDGFENVIWSTSGGGSESADGKFLLSCTGSNSGDGTVFRSSEAVRVTNLDELKGKSFLEKSCGPSEVFTINADGSASSTEGVTATAGEVAQFFSDAGLNDGEGVYRGEGWKLNINGATRYFLVYSNNDLLYGKSVGYGVQQ